MDSHELSDRVADAFDGKAPTVEDGKPGIGINIHAIVKVTLEVLADAGFINLEEGRIDD